ncbi:type I secretion protein [Oricola nitratireducens]|uniref:type I secretion protein n=1 Tax=Oricola nitratireducens TaxID=2775868 RepID=UPI0018679715|nr:type I secretion protein [Oricola nitratireducens]
MNVSLDPITEAIAHFIGFFELAVEEARGRLDYDEFRALKAKQMDGAEIIAVGNFVNTPYQLLDVQPDLHYQPFDQSVVPLWARSHVDGHYLPPATAGADTPHPNTLPGLGGFLLSLGTRFEFTVTPPGSIAVVAQQVNHVYDNDYLNMTDAKVDTMSSDYLDAGLGVLAAEASDIDPIGALTQPDSEIAIADLVEEVARIVRSDQEEGPSEAQIHVAAGADADGIHSNGVRVDEAPLLSDYLPENEEPEEPQPVSVVHGEGHIEMHGDVTLDAGSNLLVNEAFIGSNWIVAPVFAVAGDTVHVNIVSQVNVWSDADTIGSEFSGWLAPDAAATRAFNIASVTLDPAPPADADAEPALSGLPEQWHVTRLDGNLVLLNWIEQLSFMTDHDTAILTHAGSQSLLQTGGNTTINSFSLGEFGNYYDLVVVGGSYHYANVIEQKNILLDDDFVWSQGDFATSGHASLSTSDNLLWNQANIHAAGQMQFESMPDHYLEAMQSLASGSDDLNAGVLGDAAFAGFDSLSVLYISGSILSLKYISQTNILGDSDQIAMFGEEQDGVPTDWTISTGSNDLLNIASIAEGGVDSTVYTGGEIYSDALLYQAELISNDPFGEIGAPSDLASEAVLFLADDMLDPDCDHDNADAGTHAPDTVHVDVMQTMLA